MFIATPTQLIPLLKVIQAGNFCLNKLLPIKICAYQALLNTQFSLIT
ncbi:hypothetical protein PSPO_a3035 [Pseudoalteromonas spongiae UST010723-006]|nr:hypothetical protein PSPO_a3035 [Pseudoalteromonas spongiae UST010723-006]